MRHSTLTKTELDTLTRAELIKDVAYATRVSREAAEVTVDAMLETIVQSLKAGLKVELRGFGSFGVRRHGLRIGRNPAGHGKMTVAAKRVPYFEPGRELARRVGS